MVSMDNIFPENTLDPTAGTKEQEYHVERTLGVMGHIRGIARKRKWLFLQIGDEIDSKVSYIRDFYKLPTAPVTHKNGLWAIWSGDGEPTSEAFAEVGELDEMVAAAPPGTFMVAIQEAADLKSTMDEVAKRKAGTPILDAANETWAYTSNIPEYVSDDPVGAFRKIRHRYKAARGDDAPVEIHPSGDIAAVWLGKGTPARPAFPGTQPLPKTNGHTALVDAPPVGVPIGELDAPPPVKPIPVSPFAPGNALNKMGLELYGMSKEEVFSEEFRGYLRRVSDSMHAEAARFDLMKVRAGFDRTYGKK
jgi:hypothetical protein